MLARRSRHLPTTVGRMDGLQFHDIDSPIGRLGLVVSSRGVAKVLLETDDIEAECARITEDAEIPLAAHQLEEYFAGRRQQFTVPLDFRFATDFHRQVLEELARVPHRATPT